jgi:hypothetical protein
LPAATGRSGFRVYAGAPPTLTTKTGIRTASDPDRTGIRTAAIRTELASARAAIRTELASARAAIRTDFLARTRAREGDGSFV